MKIFLKLRLWRWRINVTEHDIASHQEADKNIQNIRTSRREANVRSKKSGGRNPVNASIFNKKKAKPRIHGLNETIPSKCLTGKKLMEFRSLSANWA